MKMEAVALFAGIRAQAQTDRWWYHAEMRRLGRPVTFEQSLSPYRASLRWDYVFAGIDCQVFLEREAHVGRPGEDVWMLSFSGIEGKVKALTLHDHLKGLQQQGFYIPNGNENLERQMNFSLGLYGACLMHVDVHFPPDQKPLSSALTVLDLLDRDNHAATPSLETMLGEIEARRQAALALDENDDPDVIMGDWQTWK